MLGIPIPDAACLCDASWLHSCTAAASGLDLLARAGAVAAPATTVRFSDSVENHGGNRGGGKKRIRPTPVEPPAREFAPQPTPTMPEAQEGTEEMFEV